MHDMNLVQRDDVSYATTLDTAFHFVASVGGEGDDSGGAHRYGLTGLPGLARKLYEFGHRRSKFLPSGLFGEPAWYILLDLYASEAEGRAISVTSASVASGAPASTGLRMVRILEDKGLVSKGKVDQDRRRCDVQLTPAGRSAVERTLREVGPMLGQVLAAA